MQEYKTAHTIERCRSLSEVIVGLSSAEYKDLAIHLLYLMEINVILTFFLNRSHPRQKRIHFVTNILTTLASILSYSSPVDLIKIFC